MGNASSRTVTVKNILALGDNLPLADTTAGVNASEELQKRGIVVEEGTSEEDVLKALRILEHDDFWRTHAELHPNYSHVKNWLWIHSRYRTQLDAMAAAESQDEAKKQFSKWCSKLAGHSSYEDEQLFKFFRDHIVSSNANLGDNLDKLSQHHGDLKAQNDVFSGGDDAWKERLKSYVEDMKQHMLFEEQSIVEPWLSLTNEQYKTYRSYLSWKYAAMY